MTTEEHRTAAKDGGGHMTRLTWQRELPSVAASDMAELRAHRFRDKSLPMLAAIKSVLANYADERLTVRQLYYRLVALGYIHNNREAYGNLDKLLTRAREAGAINWRVFEDRARRVDGTFEDDDLRDCDPEGTARRQVAGAFEVHSYMQDQWAGQPSYVEVWCEKDALAGPVGGVCSGWGVPLVVVRGYSSVTYVEEAKERCEEQNEGGRDSHLLYLGDLDPSGWNIYEVIQRGLGDLAEITRLGLNPEQVQDLHLPPTPQKDGDSRCAAFRRRFPDLGKDGYELDALEPAALRRLVADGIAAHFDEDAAEEAREGAGEWQARYATTMGELKQRVLGDTP